MLLFVLINSIFSMEMIGVIGIVRHASWKPFKNNDEFPFPYPNIKTAELTPPGMK